MNWKRLFVAWMGTAILAWLIVVVPVVAVLSIVLPPDYAAALSAFAFLFGMAVGGLAPVVVLSRANPISRWIER